MVLIDPSYELDSDYIEVINFLKIIDERFKNFTILYRVSVNIVFSRNFNKGDRKKEREIFQRVCDIKKIKKELNYDPKINLSDGLKKVLEQKKIYKNWP